MAGVKPLAAKGLEPWCHPRSAGLRNTRIWMTIARTDWSLCDPVARKRLGCGPGKARGTVQVITACVWKCLRRLGKPGRDCPKGVGCGCPRHPKPTGEDLGSANLRVQPQNRPCSTSVLLRAGNTVTTGAKPMQGLTTPCAAPPGNRRVIIGKKARPCAKAFYFSKR